MECNECGTEIEDGNAYASHGVCSSGCHTAQELRRAGNYEDV